MGEAGSRGPALGVHIQDEKFGLRTLWAHEAWRGELLHSPTTRRSGGEFPPSLPSPASFCSAAKRGGSRGSCNHGGPLPRSSVSNLYCRRPAGRGLQRPKSIEWCRGTLHAGPLDCVPLTSRGKLRREAAVAAASAAEPRRSGQDLGSQGRFRGSLPDLHPGAPRSHRASPDGGAFSAGAPAGHVGHPDLRSRRGVGAPGTDRPRRRLPLLPTGRGHHGSVAAMGGGPPPGGRTPGDGGPGDEARGTARSPCPAAGGRAPARSGRTGAAKGCGPTPAPALSGTGRQVGRNSPIPRRGRFAAQLIGPEVGFAALSKLRWGPRCPGPFRKL